MNGVVEINILRMKYHTCINAYPDNVDSLVSNVSFLIILSNGKLQHIRFSILHNQNLTSLKNITKVRKEREKVWTEEK